MTGPRQPKQSDKHWKLAANYTNIAAGGALVAAGVSVPLARFNPSAQLDYPTALQFAAAFILGSLILHGVGQIFLRRAMS